ncbi:reverse transcriptase domain-containing protein [Tanacetum coccineum]
MLKNFQAFRPHAMSTLSNKCFASSFCKWISDSGATHHMSYIMSQFILLNLNSSKSVVTANGDSMALAGIGSVDTPFVALSDVYYIPSLTINLVSISKIYDSGCDVNFSISDLHSDVWGPAPVSTKGGSRYYVSFIDDFARYTWVYMMKRSMGIRHAKPYTLRGGPSTKLGQRLFKAWQLNIHKKNSSISSKPDRAHICTISGAILPTTTTMFAATTPKNTPLAYRVSILTNPNPVISPTFVEANYQTLESLLRDRRRQMRNNDLRTKLEYFSEDYDEEREMEPRPEPVRAATPPLRVASPTVRRRRKRVVGFEETQNRREIRVERNSEGGRPSEEASRGNGIQNVNLPPLLATHIGRSENGQPLQSSLTFVYGGQALLNNIGGNLPPNGTFLSHNAQPLIPANLNVPNGLMPMHPMYTFPNMPAYANPNSTCLFPNPLGSVTPFVRWIEDYPLPDGLKMPSHIGSYDRKGDLDNFLHLFEGAIRMHKWLMPVACHIFTYTLKDSARIWWNSQKEGSILDYEDLKAKF